MLINQYQTRDHAIQVDVQEEIRREAGGIAALKQLKDVPDFEEHNKLTTNLVEKLEWGCGVKNNPVRTQSLE